MNTGHVSFDGITISPDDQQVAYLTDKGLVISSADRQTTPNALNLTNDEEVSWIGSGPRAVQVQ